MKTTENEHSVDGFIESVADLKRREECKTLDELCQKITGEKGRMWGSSIVGYGKYSYTRSDNKFYEYLALGFSPRAKALTIYNLPGYQPYEKLMKGLGKFKMGKSCLYVANLSDIDLEVLKEILSDGYKSVAGKHLDYKTGIWTDTK